MPQSCITQYTSLSYGLLEHRWGGFAQPKLYGMNYCTPYPIAKGLWDYFSENVQSAVDIGIDAATITGTKQATLADQRGSHLSITCCSTNCIGLFVS